MTGERTRKRSNIVTKIGHSGCHRVPVAPESPGCDLIWSGDQVVIGGGREGRREGCRLRARLGFLPG